MQAPEPTGSYNPTLAEIREWPPVKEMEFPKASERLVQFLKKYVIICYSSPFRANIMPMGLVLRDPGKYVRAGTYQRYQLSDDRRAKVTATFNKFIRNENHREGTGRNSEECIRIPEIGH